jgi:hypothetical protein
LGLEGQEADKQRLLVIAYLCKVLKMPEIEMANLGVDLTPVRFLERRRTLMGDTKEDEVSALTYFAKKVKGIIGGEQLGQVAKILHSVLSGKA